ncbi:MAG TPA: isoprenylcysteine carboxylmethyltransferase family protein [Opitutales bacterium]|nr:isoprenylcysteine carboxylmethyltransferase family protein [Opitutales bacterium]
MRQDFYRQAALLTSFTERFILSAFYFVYAWAYYLMITNLWPDRAHWADGDLVEFAREVTMVLLLFFEGLTLLLARRATATPRNLEEVAVPLAASFFYLAYGAMDWLPHALADSVLPLRWQEPVAVAGLGVDVLGTVISMWGVIYLGRSFGIFVAVRKVVLRGPYRFMRHPIYCGYLFMFAGLALTYSSPAALVLVTIHIALFIYRARLEEARLAEHSAEYRDHQRRTGFIFPKLRVKREGESAQCSTPNG